MGSRCPGPGRLTGAPLPTRTDQTTAIWAEVAEGPGHWVAFLGTTSEQARLHSN